MAEGTSVVWDEVFTAYDFGPTHPMAPVRLDLTTRLARSLGVLDHVTLVVPEVADDDVLATVHDREYIEAVHRASADPTVADVNRGLGTEDDPAFASWMTPTSLASPWMTWLTRPRNFSARKPSLSMAVTLWPRRRSSSAAAAPNRPSPMTRTSSSWAALRAM